VKVKVSNPDTTTTDERLVVMIEAFMCATKLHSACQEKNKFYHVKFADRSDRRLDDRQQRAE
jgi:hypothetical protein